jgi:iron complex outermembrane recepter protein
MNKFIILIILFCCQIFFLKAQNKGDKSKKDTIAVINLDEVIISSPRIPYQLKSSPFSISMIENMTINSMTKTIAADEVFRLVPGVRIDNGTGGSRVHFYIRGQGVLSESGFRGIGVMIDGITVNDPGGFAPDLYDVDWETVKSVEVMKGLSASMYGGSASGGVINISTFDGGEKPVNVTLYQSAGSYGFWKSLAQVDGTKDKVNYRISYSHLQGNGYRTHQAFMGDNFSEKLNWTPSEKVKITQLLSYTSYFNQNSEGINLGRYDTIGPRAANTDAIPYNEFHKTQRLTGATIGKFNICKNQDISIKGFFRINNYKETSNNGADYKPFINPGFSAQYNLHHGTENLKNHISLGGDFEFKKMTEHWFAVPDGNHIDRNRADVPFSEAGFDTDQILINQIINQRSAGLFFIDKLDIYKKLFATINLRYDNVYNQLINNLNTSDSLSSEGHKVFEKSTYRLGLAYDMAGYANIYANYGTGFLVPTEDELYNNPVHYGGFNSIIKPSTSEGAELGIRGNVGKMLYYDVTGFLINSKNEFYRYSVPGRGNNTAFFGNMGASRRTGIETFFSFSPVDYAKFDAAYTYSKCIYTSPDSVKNHFIPQCPEHVLAAEVSFRFLKHFTLTLNTEFQSKWFIQVDDSIYYQFHENNFVRKSDDRTGFNIYSAGLKYEWKLGLIKGDISLFAKNIFDEHYFGFTEPNNGPDYNSYQPAPGREFFASLKIRF